MKTLLLEPTLSLQSPHAAVRPTSVFNSPHGDSFLEQFCHAHACAPEKFMNEVLRRCLARRALPIFWLKNDSELFVADRALIRAVAQAVDMTEVNDAIEDYWGHSANFSRLRRVLGLRISTRRLRWMAITLLPTGDLSPISRAQ